MVSQSFFFILKAMSYSHIIILEENELNWQSYHRILYVLAKQLKSVKLMVFPGKPSNRTINKFRGIWDIGKSMIAMLSVQTRIARGASEQPAEFLKRI